MMKIDPGAIGFTSGFSQDRISITVGEQITVEQLIEPRKVVTISMAMIISIGIHFSFFMFFSDFVIFQVVKWMFLIFHDFQFSCHIPRPTVDISKFSTFFTTSSLSFLCILSKLKFGV